MFIVRLIVAAATCLGLYAALSRFAVMNHAVMPVDGMAVTYALIAGLLGAAVSLKLTA